MPGGGPIEFWIQLENHAWDVSPNNIDRLTGQTIQQVTQMMGSAKTPMNMTLTSPVTGNSHPQTMFYPLSNDALILRRYTANWAAPDDRKVNPWDQNEPDPTDTGTMGTIPGATIECEVGDTVIVHLRNMDNRTFTTTITFNVPIPGDGTIPITFPVQEPLPTANRTHSLHPHGFVFAPTSDGAYPLSPPDPGQPIPASESAAWASIGVTGFKQGDRVPPGGTYDYTWQTVGWPATAGVWLYHDHSICSDDSVRQGAIGLIVIHNPNDPQDVNPQDLPEGSPLGSPIQPICFPFPFDVPASPTDLGGLGAPGAPQGQGMMTMPTGIEGAIKAIRKAGGEERPLIAARTIRHGDFLFELDEKLEKFRELCLPFYITPPNKAQYLLLFHTLGDAGMCINGRKFLGNTPTVVSGPTTLMRFGVVGMISDFHTFHLHGHRWTIPGPDGTSPNVIQGSIQNRAVSQFEDTRAFGPANSFSFTIQQDSGSFFGAFPGQAVGEWHMHCHVQSHMMDGMMGSLKIINGGELALFLPSGQPCPPAPGTGGTTGGGGTVQVSIIDNAFSPANVMITRGQTVQWTNNGSSPHTVTSNPGTLGCNPPSTESFASPTLSSGNTFTHTFGASGTFAYHCEVHGCPMAGTVTVM